MSVNLTKGSSINLSKEVSGTLKKVQAGLGWTKNCDLDSYVVLLDKNNRVIDFIYFGHKRSQGVRHNGDDTSGGGRKTDPNETIDIDLSDQNSEVKEILVGLAIYNGVSSLSQAGSAFGCVKDMESGKELVRYNVAEGFGSSRDVVIGKFVANSDQSQWKFSAVGETSMDRWSQIESRYRKNSSVPSSSPRQTVSEDNGEDRPGFLGRLFGRS